MELVIKTFEELSNIELYEILRIRSSVFVVEQNCVYQDIDGIDLTSLHFFLKEDENICAYLRAFQKEEGVVQIGRVLTTKRGLGLGERLLKEAVETIKTTKKPSSIYLEAQTYATKFYEKAGFEVISKEFLEDGIPHVKMLLTISDS